MNINYDGNSFYSLGMPKQGHIRPEKEPCELPDVLPAGTQIGFNYSGGGIVLTQDVEKDKVRKLCDEAYDPNQREVKYNINPLYKPIERKGAGRADKEEIMSRILAAQKGGGEKQSED